MLNNNKIKFVGYELLNPLKRLKIINFGGNICLVSSARNSEEFERLKDEMKLKCSDISMLDLLVKINVLQSQIEYTLRRIESFNAEN